MADQKIDCGAAISPINPVDGWKTIPIQECGEPLVALGPFSKYNMIFSDPVYFGGTNSSPYGDGELRGALLTPFARQGVAEALKRASELLPEGHALLVWDAYRPLSVQQSLYDDYYRQLLDTGLERDAASKEAQKFVSVPSTDPTRPPPRHTGAAIDLTIVRFTPDAWKEMKGLAEVIKLADSKGDWQVIYKAEMKRLQLLHEHSKPLNMGTAFDQVSPATETRYYEKKLETGTLSPEETEILDNRRLFVNVMQKVGFGNYPDEWWHFDKNNQFHAARSAQPAIYGAAQFSETGELENSNRAWEDMRQGHWARNVAWQRGHPLTVTTKLGVEPHQQLARSVAIEAPDIRKARFWASAARLTLAKS